MHLLNYILLYCNVVYSIVFHHCILTHIWTLKYGTHNHYNIGVLSLKLSCYKSSFTAEYDKELVNSSSNQTAHEGTSG